MAKVLLNRLCDLTPNQGGWREGGETLIRLLWPFRDAEWGLGIARSSNVFEKDAETARRYLKTANFTALWKEFILEELLS